MNQVIIQFNKKGASIKFVEILTICTKNSLNSNDKI